MANLGQVRNLLLKEKKKITTLYLGECVVFSRTILLMVWNNYYYEVAINCSRHYSKQQSS